MFSFKRTLILFFPILEASIPSQAPNYAIWKVSTKQKEIREKPEKEILISPEEMTLKQHTDLSEESQPLKQSTWNLA